MQSKDTPIYLPRYVHRCGTVAVLCLIGVPRGDSRGGWTQTGGYRTGQLNAEETNSAYFTPIHPAYPTLPYHSNSN